MDWLRGKRRAMLGFKIAVSSMFVAGCHSIGSRNSAPEASQPVVVWQTSLSNAESEPESRIASRQYLSEPLKALVLVSAEDKPAHSEKTVVTQKPVVDAVPKAESDFTVDLAAAMQLAGIENPTINLAREATREALVSQRAAQVLLLPNLTVGGNLHVHRGELQASSGFLRDVNSQDLYAGAGAGALGTQTVALPGIRLFSHLGDAIYEPLAARQHLEARRSIAAATENQILLRVAAAYFDLVGAEVRLEALRKSEGDIGEIARLTASYAKRGQGRVGDAHRADANVDLLRRQTQEMDENLATASARLTGLLNLDPAIRLHSPGGLLQQVKLLDENESLETLIERGLMNRPEVRARMQEIAEAQTRIRQERTRPFLPLLSIGFSAGTFGGGSNLTAAGIAQPGGGVQVSPSFGRFDGRTDFDVFAVWTLRNGGFGNRAAVRQTEAVVGQAIERLEGTRNEIRREIAEAVADAQAAARQIEMTRTQLAAAEDGFREEMARIKQAVGRPLEAIDSFRQLLDARQDILVAVIAYNMAQYRLFVAVGLSPLQPSEAGWCEPSPFRTK